MLKLKINIYPLYLKLVQKTILSQWMLGKSFVIFQRWNKFCAIFYSSLHVSLLHVQFMHIFDLNVCLKSLGLTCVEDFPKSTASQHSLKWKVTYLLCCYAFLMSHSSNVCTRRKKSTQARRSTGVKNRSKVENEFLGPKGQLHYLKSSDWTGEAAIRTYK